MPEINDRNDIQDYNDFEYTYDELAGYDDRAIPLDFN